ncbi:MAG: tetratricopeptide repeat protein [Xanthomonadales bacterium]|nr:tetratricopeptide repeat protein [Gammaproteobacteria bacterium]MBT8053347.1 tetratricopeptide repeat protein [Gammaproteobacteria bacterium]NND58059.1 tetratricopeptide repeat protein [Xanthomonadales bacterium]NNK52156.1 tetratricopeptide repeat protein [Xanthomonadales bacterium]
MLAIITSAGMILLMNGCAATGARDGDAGRSEAPAPEAAEQTPEAGAMPVAPTDEEVMYRIFAAEYLGSEGDFESAVADYLEAAMISEDPAIARRATRVAYAAEAWQQAAMAADRWALLDPSNVAAHESAAIAMLLVGDYLGAEYQIIKILDLMGDSTEAWMKVSNMLSQAGSPENADEMLGQILAARESVDNAYALFARSQLAARSKDLNRAFELARQAVELSPERVEFLTWAGRLALNLQLTETGLEYVRRAWELEPEDHDLSLAYADLLARHGQEEEARTVMREMPQSPDVMLSRILFELRAQEREAADKLYAQFEQMNFEDTQAKVFFQAQAAEALGYFRQAIGFYGQVESGDRALAAAIRVAELKAMEGDIPAARQELVRLREGNNPVIVEESWLAEARILREAGRREESFQVLDDALGSMPDSIAILYSHALLAAELGWVDIAESDLRVVIAAQPENAAALNALGYTLADQTERYGEAEALIRQAYILQPDEPSIIDSMGWVTFRLGRLEEAIQFLQKAWQLDKNPEIAAHLGEVLWVSGKRDAAMAVWREGLAVDSSNMVLVETLERLGASP